MNTEQEAVISVIGSDADGTVTPHLPGLSYDYLDDFFTNYGAPANKGVIQLVPQPDGTCIARAVAVGHQNVRCFIGAISLDVTVTISAAPSDGPGPAVVFEVVISAPRPKTA